MRPNKQPSNTKSRLGVILMFGLVGSLISLWQMPRLLDYIYVSVVESGAAGTPQITPTSPGRPDVLSEEEQGIQDELEQGGEYQGGQDFQEQGGQDEFGRDITGDGQRDQLDQMWQEPGQPTEPGQAEGDQPQDLQAQNLDGGTGQVVGAGSSDAAAQTAIVDPDDASIIARQYPGRSNPLVLLGIALVGFIIGSAIGVMVVRLLEAMGAKWDRMDTGDKVDLMLGIFVGIAAALPFLFVIQSLGGGFLTPVIVFGLVLGFSALSVYAIKSIATVLPWHGGGGRKKKTDIKLLDTSVIIDGRIYDVLQAGFLEGIVYIPKFVLEELQHIADSADDMRRQRGRRGLEILRLMQADYELDTGTYDHLAPDPKADVDSKLVGLARELGGDLVTNDYNLNRVARLQGVKVLNINDLALALRPNVLPGEILHLKLIREGNQPGQAVGYLEDGTMVVVEKGKPHLESVVDVAVTQVIQTERGKLLFAEVFSDETHKVPWLSGDKP